MKVKNLIILTICFLIASVSDSSAFWWRKKEPEKAPAVEKKKEPVMRKQEVKKDSAEEARMRQQALKESKRKQLDNTQWEIELTLFGQPKKGKATKSERDIITFKDNQVSSENLSQKGFTPTNYTLTIQEGRTIVWETMQTSQKGGIAFWRGELDMDMERMQGVLSHHINERVTRDYSFLSINKKAVLP